MMGIFKKKGVVDSVTPVDPPSAEKTKAQEDVEQAREGVEQHPSMTIRRFMAIFSLGCLLAAAQIPLYLIGGSLGTTTGVLCILILAYTVADIGGQSSYAWVGIAYTLALAAICPFAGAMSDLMGRRYAALLGAGLVVIGMIIVGTAHRINVAIGGMAIAGVGAGLAEVISTAGVVELAPVESRGKYIGIIYTLILPFAASSGYGIILILVLLMSPNIFGGLYLEVGCMDKCDS
jgi:MFS family permease